MEAGVLYAKAPFAYSILGECVQTKKEAIT